MSQSAVEIVQLYPVIQPESGRETEATGPFGDLEASASRLVGVSKVEFALARAKRAMLREALSRTGGNFTRTAGLLGVRRQAVQQMVARFDLREWTYAMRLRHC